MELNGRHVGDLPAGVPEGYRRLEAGVSCRCIRLKEINGVRYCCGGAFTSPAGTAQKPAPTIAPNTETVPPMAEAEIAAEIKAAIREKLEELTAIMTEGRRHGFVTSFQLGVDAIQRDVVVSVNLVKHY